MSKLKRRVVTAREPNGRIARGLADNGPSPAEVRRLRDASLLGLRSAEWGTQLGRMLLTHKLTSEQYAAGVRWRESASRYSQALCSPAADPRAVNFDAGGGKSVDVESYEGQREAKRHAKAVASFVDANAALACVGHRAAATVRSVCERDEWPVGYENALALVSGLQALSHFWGLTNIRKSSMSDRQVAK